MKLDSRYFLIGGMTVLLVLILGVLAPVYIFNDHLLMWQLLSTLVVMLIIRWVVYRRVSKSIHHIQTILENQPIETPGVPISDVFADPNPKHIKNFEKTVKSVVRQCQQCSIDQIKALSDLQYANKTRDAMLELSNSIINIQDTESLFNSILSKAIQVIDAATHGSLMILTADNKLEYKALHGYNEALFNVQLNLKDTFLYVESQGNITQPLIIRDIQSFDQQHLDEDTFESMEEIWAFELKTTLCSPIFIEGQLYGMLNIDSADADAFDENDILTMKYFTTQTAIAIKNHQLLERTLYLSRFDKLTNIYNRSYFEEIFDEFYKKAQRYHEEFTLAILDLNNLKGINDTYGHQTGDHAIKHFADGFQGAIRSSDLFARYGGDEFIAIFFHASPDQAREKIESLITYFEEHPLKTDLGELYLSFSYGMAHFPTDSNNFDILVKIADEHMYAYKYALKNQ